MAVMWMVVYVILSLFVVALGAVVIAAARRRGGDQASGELACDELPDDMQGSRRASREAAISAAQIAEWSLNSGMANATGCDIYRQLADVSMAKRPTIG